MIDIQILPKKAQNELIDFYKHLWVVLKSPIGAVFW